MRLYSVTRSSRVVYVALSKPYFIVGGRVFDGNFATCILISVITTEPAYLTPRLRCIVFIGQPPLRHSLNFKGICLRAVHGADLTALQRDEQLARWIELTDRKPFQPETVSKGGRGKQSGVNAAARELGVSKPDAHRAVKVASLTEEAKETAKTARPRKQPYCKQNRPHTVLAEHVRPATTFSISDPRWREKITGCP